MRSRTRILLKILIVSSLLLLAFPFIKNNLPAVRIRLLDSSAVVLDAFHYIGAAARRAIPFASYRDEIRMLQKRIDYMNRRLEETASVSAENEKLKELLDLKTTLPFTTLAAQVIGRDPSNWSNSLIIDKGLDDGVKQNKAALSAKGLVGRVVEVGRHSSRILLITDPNSKVGVVIQRNGHGGVLVGRPDGRCKMIYIALDSDTAAGDKVLSAGFGSAFPKGILVGEVIEVGKERGRLYKYAIVKPAEELSRVEEVLCIK